MKKYIFKILMILYIVGIVSQVNAAVVLDRKEDAAQYSKKSDYAQEIDTGLISQAIGNGNSGGNQNGSLVVGLSQDDLAERFTCTVARKEGQTYINEWSNYKLTLEGTTKDAIDFYDFRDNDSKYDFGVYWPDWSRLAIYYTRLSRDIDAVALMFSHNKGMPMNVVVGGEVYRYIQEAVEYPYGTEYYDYYLRNVDGKLMVIECFHEKEKDLAPTFITRIEKYNG